MDDLSKKIEQFLSSPDSMEKITAALSAFTAASDAAGEQPASARPDPPSRGPSLPEGLDMNMLMKLAPLLSGVGKEDKNTALLKALRPYFHGEREKRLDEAIHIIRLINLLPLLQKGFSDSDQT